MQFGRRSQERADRSMTGFGSADKPYFEMPFMGRIVGVGWAGGAIHSDKGLGRGDMIAQPFGGSPLSIFGTTGSMCLWAKQSLLEAGTFGPQFFDTASIGNIGMGLRLSDDGLGIQFGAQFVDSSGTEHFWFSGPGGSTSPTTPDAEFDVWNLWQVSWDTSDSFASLAVNDEVKTITFQIDDGISPGWVGPVAFELNSGDYYDWWFTTELINWEVLANRRRFITEDLKPVALGADGSLGSPTNRQPEFFFHPGGPPTSYANNKGTGGDLSFDSPAPTLTNIPKPTMAGAA